MKRNLSPSAREAMRQGGARGGRATTAAKAASAQRNGRKPRRDGKRRGWPKGRPRGKCWSCQAKGQYAERRPGLWYCCMCGVPAIPVDRPAPKIHTRDCACHKCVIARHRKH